MKDPETIFQSLEEKSFWDIEQIYSDGCQMIPLYDVYKILNRFVPNWREIRVEEKGSE